MDGEDIRDDARHVHEVLMQALLRVDGMVCDGEMRRQRRIAVTHLQSLMDVVEGMQVS